MSKEGIEIKCTSFNQLTGMFDVEYVFITYDCYDDLNPNNMDAVIRSYIYKMRKDLFNKWNVNKNKSR